MSIVLLLLPDLSMVALGFVLSRLGQWGRPFWDGLERLVYYVLFPTLLFQSVLRAPLSLGDALPPVLTVVASAGVALLLVALAPRVLDVDPRKFASGAQCAFRFNTYVALALSQRLAGDAGLALCAMLVGVMVPISNVGAIVPLARHAGGRLWREMARNPLIIATVAGLIGNALHLTLPEPVHASLSRLGSAALATGLLTVGAGLVFRIAPAAEAEARANGERVRSETPLSVWLTATKLLVMPACALAVGALLELPPVPRQIAVMFAAMPTASSCYILAVRMGGDGPYVARLVSLSMIGALFTLPLWLSGVV
ncbi:MAG: AEC family transporter [Burkholderiaceae bacterium]